jgi:hypothetical protein
MQDSHYLITDITTNNQKTKISTKRETEIKIELIREIHPPLFLSLSLGGGGKGSLFPAHGPRGNNPRGPN